MNADSFNRRLIRCLLCFCLCLCLAGSLFLFPSSPLGSLPVSAAEEAPQSDRVGAAFLYNIENRMTLFEKNADEKIPPASTVKIMAGLLVCRKLCSRLDESVTVTAAMVDGVGGRNMGLAPDEVMSVRDLLYAAFCGSYNDAACVLACLAEGSVASFVESMNREAKRLGLSSTFYTNPTGLDDPAMFTTAHDVAAVAREAFQDELFMKISSAVSYTIPETNKHEERFFRNRNALISDSSRLYFNGNCRGMNAGMTDAGGFCVVTVAEQNGAANLCVIMGGADVPFGDTIPAYAYTNRLLSWASRSFTYRTLLKKGDTVDTFPVSMTGISRSCADVVMQTDLKVYLPADTEAGENLVRRVSLRNDRLEAPLKAGQSVGTVTVLCDGRVVGKGNLTVTEDFARNGFLDRMTAFRRYLTGRAFFASVICFLILFLICRHWMTGPGGRYGVRPVKRRPRRRRSPLYRRR